MNLRTLYLGVATRPGDTDEILLPFPPTPDPASWPADRVREVTRLCAALRYHVEIRRYVPAESSTEENK